jgi:hypothetical protein
MTQILHNLCLYKYCGRLDLSQLAGPPIQDSVDVRGRGGATASGTSISPRCLSPYSEDLADDRQYYGVTVHNPFSALKSGHRGSAAVVLQNGSLCVGFADDGPAGGGMAGGWQNVPLVHPTGDADNVISSGMAGGVTQPTTPGDDRTQRWVAIIVAVEAEVGPDITRGEVTLTDGEVVTATVNNGLVAQRRRPRLARNTFRQRCAVHPVTANPTDWPPQLASQNQRRRSDNQVQVSNGRITGAGSSIGAPCPGSVHPNTRVCSPGSAGRMCGPVDPGQELGSGIGARFRGCAGGRWRRWTPFMRASLQRQ